MKLFFSWQDGNPEYLSDLDRQIIQKQKLRRVNIFQLNLESLNNSTMSFRCHANVKRKAAVVTSRTLTTSGDVQAVERRSKTKTN